MNYLNLCELYEKLENTSKRLEKTLYIAEFLKDISNEESEDILLLLEGKIFQDDDDRKIGASESIVIKAINLATGHDIKSIENLWKTKGDLGLVAQELTTRKSQQSLFRQDLLTSKVVKNLKKIATLSGNGTVNQKIQLVGELLTSANHIESKYIIRTILETLRIGISSGTIRDAIIWHIMPAGTCTKCGRIIPPIGKCILCDITREEEKEITNKISNYKEISEKVELAYNIVNNFGIILKILRDEGIDGLKVIKPKIGSPLKVMLYQKVKTVNEAFEQVGRPAAIEYKYDGFRIQVHKNEEEIKIYTRSMEDVTLQFPEVVEYAKTNINAKHVIIDGEAVGYDVNTNQYLPFQKISQRIKRKYDIDEVRSQISVEWTIFDILMFNDSTLSLPFIKRREIIEKIVKIEDKKVVLSKILITDDTVKATEFYHQALKDRQEGVMFKNLNSIYVPGSRVGTGVKLKPIMDPLDLVIVGAEWGEGKRTSWFTSFTLACRNEEELLEIGKVGTGFKEITSLEENKNESNISFEELTNLLKPLIIADKGKEITVKPKIILEIAFEEIQKSNSYSSGYALRFPRVLRIRPEKPVDEISTLEDIKKYYKEQ